MWKMRENSEKGNENPARKFRLYQKRVLCLVRCNDQIYSLLSSQDGTLGI